MAYQDSRTEYVQRMHRVLAHIDQHLDRALSLQELAEVAHFSPFHFHRLFAAWMGETLGDYLRRRRVEVAAMRLSAQPKVKVLNVALSVGFGSSEAFTRAFRSRFGCAPSVWRDQRRDSQNSKMSQVVSNSDQADLWGLSENAFTLTTQPGTPMKVTLIDRAPATIAYLRHVGPYGPAVGRFWQETYVPWAVMNKLGFDHARYGISYDDPSVTAPEQCRYDACAEVAEDFVVNGGALKGVVPGGQYAVYQFKGSNAAISGAWMALLRDWLPSSGFQLDARPCFEYYPKGSFYDEKSGEFTCEICIPVMPL